MAKINKTICDLCGEEFTPLEEETYADGSPVDPDDSVFDPDEDDFTFVSTKHTTFAQAVRAQANKGSEDICEACYEKLVVQATKAIEKTRENIIHNANMKAD